MPPKPGQIVKNLLKPLKSKGMIQIILFAALFVLACESKKSTQLKSDNVPVFNVPGKSGSEIPWEALVENIEIIPLETNQNSLMSDIDHIIFDQDNIYIQSWHDNVL